MNRLRLLGKANTAINFRNLRCVGDSAFVYRSSISDEVLHPLLVYSKFHASAISSRSSIRDSHCSLGFLGSESIGIERKHGFIPQKRKHTDTGNHLGREFLLKLWAAERTKEKIRSKIRKNIRKRQSHHQVELEQPPSSQTLSSFVHPSSQLEKRIAPLLARSNLLITREIEWANLVVGFEQENRYAIIDVCYPESPVGFIREQSNLIVRQLLRSRRPFIAHIVDAKGNELFRVRRPFWWITSSIFAEVDGQEIGVVHNRWHLWRRIYDLYLGNKQFAVVENRGLWDWTFTLEDREGNVLAQIDRNWRGFGYEIFTDAGKYVIRFGSSDPNSKTGPAQQVEDLDVFRPLTISERAIAVALAISLDNDYFSRHTGWRLPFFVVED